MPNVIVTCTFNPPVVSLQGASLRQETIDQLQKALPNQTSTSQPSQRHTEPPKFLLTNGAGSTDGAAAAATTDSTPGAQYTSWKIDLGQHYCDQNGRSMIYLSIMSALQEEGFAMRGANTIATESEKEITRMIFSKAQE